MINVLDLLYVSLAISSLVIAGFFAYTAYQAALTLKSIRKTVDKVEDTTYKVTADLASLSEGLKHGVLGIISKLLRKGGEKVYGA